MEAREPTSEEITDYAYHLAHLVCAITEPGQNECSYPAYAIVNPDGEEEGDGWGICTYHFAEFPDHLWEGNDVVKIPAGRLARAQPSGFSTR